MATYYHWVYFSNTPEANLHDLANTVDPHTKLYAYNNTGIKQFGVCELLVEYKLNRKICEFYVVHFPSAILGIQDSEILKLITVHFDSIGAEMSQVETPRSTSMYVNAIQNNADSDEFSIKIKHDYKDLFTGIRNMNTMIDIKLRDDAVPYVHIPSRNHCIWN